MSYLLNAAGGPLDGLPLGFAHRGGTRDENTLAAFRRAWEAGYACLETDVHASADGVLYAFHDPEVGRVTAGAGRVAALRSQELDVLTVHGAARDAPARLERLLTELPEARFNVDLKADGLEQEFVRVLHATGARRRVLAASFVGRRGRRVHRLDPEVARGASRGLVAVSLLLGPLAGPVLRAAVRRGVLAMQVPVRQGPIRIVRPAWIRRMHAASLQVHVWTVNDPQQARELLDLGVDGLMTDELEMLATVLAERGAWPQSQLQLRPGGGGVRPRRRGDGRLGSAGQPPARRRGAGSL